MFGSWIQKSTYVAKGLVILMAAIIPSATASSAAAAPAPKGDSPSAAILVVVCGDSTITSYPENDPNKLGRGWGQMLQQHFQDNVKVVNLASPGQSSKSFLDQPAKYQKAMDLKPQFVFIQFGHNDGPGKGPARQTDPNTTYSDNLRTMIDKAHAIGAECILVTPMERRGFDKNGKINTGLLGPYSAATKRVGKEKGVFVIDLHDKSVVLYEKLGKAAAQDEFAHGMTDGTHFGEKGSKIWADIICQELAHAGPKYDALKNAIKKSVPATGLPAGVEK
jgi:lysophospholipase L1-like esterase